MSAIVNLFFSLEIRWTNICALSHLLIIEYFQIWAKDSITYKYYPLSKASFD
jgi:hypothetical protein